MIKAEDIRLYPMTIDVTGRRTHEQYVDDMASIFVRIVTGYRLDFETQRQLIDYAEQHYKRLNK